MQHNDVVKRKSQKDTQRMFVQGNPKRNKQECENGNDVCASVQLATTCVCKKACCDNQKDGQMNDGGRTDTETPDKREPVLARPERDAHQETAEEDVVCGAGTDTETPDRREPVPPRAERDAHQEIADEDAVCRVEAGRMC